MSYKPQNAGVELLTEIFKRLYKMIKKLFVILICFFLLSCKKENNIDCWHCTIRTGNGINQPDQDYCANDGGKRQFTDAQGNDLSSYCVKKN